MDTQTQRHDADNRHHDQAVFAWLVSDGFTNFMTLTFAAAVKQAVDEQVAKGVIQPR